MRIEIQIFNTTIGEKVFCASAQDIDGAIAELGSIGRIFERGNICLNCREPLVDGNFCSDECSLQHNISLTEHKDEIDGEPNIF